ncbi:hypothetical protein VFPPC_16024 [Pochonia chlamydosporia 170]|uniref:Uncharacterized protein n=1 Tax=Pochonia chlamydosporia 170 TaxID=1380566 RepID=A0A179FMD3_METCM|nr:hypothetical protein VFPPC_16024 [Pochonia chlamydosporia 170]OAQ66410.1 hypothetical protein VFPPC_16024 [Pochonia chlamydosporia 170]
MLLHLSKCHSYPTSLSNSVIPHPWSLLPRNHIDPTLLPSSRLTPPKEQIFPA